MGLNVVYIGIFLSLSSGILMNYRLYKLDTYLKINYPDLWKKFGFGSKNVNLLVKQKRLRNLAVEYEADDINLNDQLRSALFVNRLSLIGVSIVLLGVGIVIVETIINA